MPSVLAVAALVRWAHLAALAGLLGSLAIELGVLPSALDLHASARASVRRLTFQAATLLIVTSVAELILRARTMAGGVAPAVAALPLVLRATHFGTIWAMRACCLVLLVALCRSREWHARAAALVVVVAIAFTTALSGHAADWGDVTASVVGDAIHIIAAGAWTGGLICLTVAVLPDSRAREVAVLATIARRFSRLAGICVLAVLATGALNAWTEIGSVSALWTTPYGRLVVVKLTLVGGLLGLGAANRYPVVPALQKQADSRDGYRGERLVALIACEAILALAVLACTAVLGQATPPRHHREHATSRPPAAPSVCSVPSLPGRRGDSARTGT